MPHKILIVDDNEPTCKLLAGVLENAGYEVHIALNGDAAIKIAKKNKISCALIDQYMEPTNGFMLARHFVLYDLKMPMIMITGNDSSDLLSRAREVGFGATMLKPVDHNHLLKLVERYCR